MRSLIHLFILPLIIVSCATEKLIYKDIGRSYTAEFECRGQYVPVYSSTKTNRKLNGTFVRTAVGEYDTTVHFKLISTFEKGLHPDFRVSSSNLMGKPGVMIMDKQKYLMNIREGIFGGLPRDMSIESIDENNSIALVKLRLESRENYLVSYNSLVLDSDGEWKLIHNLAVVEAKR